MWAFVDTGLVWDGRGTDLGTERYEGFAGCLNVPLFLLLGRLSRGFFSVFLSQTGVFLLSKEGLHSIGVSSFYTTFFRLGLLYLSPCLPLPTAHWNVREVFL
jgi:hypothetical protein